MPLSDFHPVIAAWFQRRFGAPTDVQARSWPVIRSGTHVLIAAPTGSGKTLAAFLACIDQLFKQAVAGELGDRTRIVYVSPLKALSNDVQKNLQQPLAEIQAAALDAGLLQPEIRVAVRTGDTSAADRAQMLRRPPHILITTPESLYLLLTAQRSRLLLREVRTVIVDEIHAVAPNKRGSHLTLSLERLDHEVGGRLLRVGLSATQRPIERVARFLVGARPASSPGGEACRIVDVGHRRSLDVAVEVPRDELGAVATNAIWSDVYDRIAELVRAHRSTLVFVNTRRLVERVAHHLGERLQDLGAQVVAAHHGSLSRTLRLSAEDRLKRGVTRVVVATASLELGIDVGAVDLVCQVGSPRAIATGLQRIGRAGHWVGAVPKGRLFATTRDELVECAALARAIREGQLDQLEIPPAPLDVLAQQLVASVASQEWREETLFETVRRADPYRELARADFDAVLRMLADGIATRRGRGHAYVHHDRVNRRLRARRGARLAAITSGGAIADTATYAVVAEPEGTVVGSVDEDFAVESLSGDIILLGNASWRIRGVEQGRMRVEDAHGAPPTIPFWRGEAPARTIELSAEVARVRDEIQRRVPDPEAALEPAINWLEADCGLDRRGAEQAAAYVLAGRAVLGTVPTQRRIIAERFFDEGGGMQMVIHAPFGGRINRAWGLALRKRFCMTFDFELQAAATDEGLVLSLGERHSFPLDTAFAFLRSETVREVVTQAVLASPMFTSRWRWNASRSLAILRFSNGRKVPPQLLRMRAEDLLAAVFPAAVACQDNVTGDPAEREIPDHPLVEETIRDCLREAMDVEGLEAVLRGMEAGEIACVSVESPLPSPFCHEILNANPYAYLDDAPLEERRARAVEMRRTLPPELAERAGALDPDALAEVTAEAWPDVRDADELHDALLSLVWVPASRATEWDAFMASLSGDRRATTLEVPRSSSLQQETEPLRGYVAAEHLEALRAVFPAAVAQPDIPGFTGDGRPEPEEAIHRMVQGWMESIGPTTAGELAATLGIPVSAVDAALLRLEADGQVLRGRFRPDPSRVPRPASREAPGFEWCHRRLLARIHRLTIGRLRREIEAVSASDYMRFLFQWQHVAPGARLHGEAGLQEVLGQLAGFEAPASAWERAVLPARLGKYDAEWLDRLCLRGAMGWGRLTPRPAPDEELGAADEPRPRRVIPTSLAPLTFFPREDAAWLLPWSSRPPVLSAVSPVAQDVYQYLRQHGASFFQDLAMGTGHVPAALEDALWELVAAGLLTADGFDGMRALLDPRRRRAQGRDRLRRPRHGAGRWSLLRAAPEGKAAGMEGAELVQRVARQLLRRYGVVFRDVLARDSLALAWRDLLVQYRRLELSGEVRGGRFVAGFTGEQFALPEAVEALRAVRRSAEAAEARAVTISPADPLNLVGIIVPGPRISALSTQTLQFRGGVFVQPAPSRVPSPAPCETGQTPQPPDRAIALS